MKYASMAQAQRAATEYRARIKLLVQEHRHELISGALLTIEAWAELFKFGVLPGYDQDRAGLDAMYLPICDEYEAMHKPVTLDDLVAELQALVDEHPDYTCLRAVLQFAKEKNLTFHARAAADVRSRQLVEDCCRAILAAYSARYGCGDLVAAFNERAATIKNQPMALRKLGARHDVA